MVSSQDGSIRNGPSSLMSFLTWNSSQVANPRLFQPHKKARYGRPTLPYNKLVRYNQKRQFAQLMSFPFRGAWLARRKVSLVVAVDGGSRGMMLTSGLLRLPANMTRQQSFQSKLGSGIRSLLWPHIISLEPIWLPTQVRRSDQFPRRTRSCTPSFASCGRSPCRRQTPSYAEKQKVRRHHRSDHQARFRVRC